jgi:hypothetical protein
MAYTLEYFDKDLNRKVTHEIEADTTKKAVIATNRILEGKNYSAPNLYEK